MKFVIPQLQQKRGTVEVLDRNGQPVAPSPTEVHVRYFTGLVPVAAARRVAEQSAELIGGGHGAQE